MRAVERALWIVVTSALATALLVERSATTPGSGDRLPDVARPRASPGVRISMDALHQQGGVPLGWQARLAPGNPAAGRAAFEALGCPACHRIAGEAFTGQGAAPTGPELTGMGRHHPPIYFAEAILDPDAVLVEGPGWIDASGHSAMPSYDTITLRELTDVVAYLAALPDERGAASCHGDGPSTLGSNVTLATVALADRPAPASSDAAVFFSQTYDVLPGRRAEFEAWFASRGGPGFLAASGVVGIETFVDLARPARALTTVLGFRDEASLRTFLADPRVADLWKELDAFVGSHGHHTTTLPLAYAVPSLSARH